MHKLFPYQEDGVRHLSSPLWASYLADKPGLGKTLQAVTTAKEMGAKSVAVFCPAAIVSQWQEQFRGWSDAHVVSYDALSRSGPKEGDSKATLQSKQKAQQLRARIRAHGLFDVIILDEAHYLKERGSLRTGFIFHPKHGMLQFAKKVILLSGTPVLNRPAELYPVLRRCYPEAIKDCVNFTAYAYKFCNPREGFNGAMDFSGASNLDELSKRLDGFMLARDESVLGDRFPSVKYIHSKIVIETIIDKDEHVATKRRLTGEAKTNILIQDISRIAREVGKLVVFYYHDSVRVELQRKFPNVPLIKGGLTSFQKSQQIERFVKLPVNMILVQLGAGGVGLDGLQYVCSHGYMAEYDWTPALIEQAEARLRRVGQKDKCVTIYKPLGMKQGLDGRITAMNAAKALVIKDILKSVTRNVDVIETILETNTMDEKLDVLLSAILEQLTRIADAAEGVAPVGNSEPAPAPKTAAKGKKAKADDLPPVEEPVAPTITLAQVQEAVKAEMNTDARFSSIKRQAYNQLCGDWGVKVAGDVKPEELESFLAAALSAMQNAKAPEADNDDV